MNLSLKFGGKEVPARYFFSRFDGSQQPEKKRQSNQGTISYDLGSVFAMQNLIAKQLASQQMETKLFSQTICVFNFNYSFWLLSIVHDVTD